MRHIFIAILLTPVLSFGQIIVDYPFEESLIEPWNVGDINHYEGVYSYGMSERESNLFLAIDGNQICVQIKDNVWVNSENPKERGWEARFINYTNVKIIDNMFYSDQSNGEFVKYIFEDREISGLKLETPPNSNDDKYEIGILSTSDKLLLVNGKYPRTKFDVMPVDFWLNFGSFELKIIRNEIFARYGYVFKEGGEMSNWFKFKSWYQPRGKNVNKLLTEIEKENIANIQKAEYQKKSP